jgi:hypothetical protein
MTDLSLAQKALFSALNGALSKALKLYELENTPSHFDTIASVVEACFNAGLSLKPSHHVAVQQISHFEKPYYYYIVPETGKVLHAIGGGIPESLADPRHPNKPTRKKGILQ